MNDKKDFTLIELLLVVSIITLLLSMLLPGLHSAKEAARSNVCANNLKQIGLALYSYSDDSNSRFPQYYDGSSRWTQLIYNLKYISMLDIFVCPSCFPFKYTSAEDPTLRKTLGFNRYASGINLNKFPVENAEAGVGWWDDMRTLTKAIILSDSYMDVDKRQTYFWYPDVSSAERLIRRNHQNSANILCLDGHIEKAQGAELKNNFNITYLY